MSVQSSLHGDCGNLIGGDWVNRSGAGRIDDRNPARPDELVATFPSAGADDVRRAIDAARRAAPSWASTPAPTRGALLQKASDILAARTAHVATVLTTEEGKTLGEATAEVLRAVDILRYYAGEGWRQGGAVLPGSGEGELLYTRREPLGVVSVITPWNFPIAIPAWKIAPALAYGNTVVFKPATDAPLTAMLLVQAFVEAGIPPGVLNFVTGQGSVAGAEMVANRHVNGVTFTGSYDVGTSIYTEAVKHLARVQLEMGGKNALVVLQDASIDFAVRLAVRGGFGLTGQACTATSLVIVEEPIADRFIEALVHAVDQLIVGDGLEPGVNVGPAVSESQLARDLRYIAIGATEGASLRTGGRRRDSTGFFIAPAVFDGVSPDMRIAREEIFGPVISVIKVRNFDEALAVLNDGRFGLTAGVVTNDLQRAFQFANQADVGVVKVNQATSGLALQAPFGGFKQSSANTFKEQGAAAVEFYTRTKTVYVAHG